MEFLSRAGCGWLIACLAHGCWSAVAFAQTNSETESATPPVELRGVVVFRISEKYLERLFAKDIDKTGPVQRTVLGTRARGTAHTTGKASIDTQPDAERAAFRVRIDGESRSRTRGRNGPAIIHSRAVTKWQAHKVVRFDGLEFKTSPATITSTTKIYPAGVDATVPGVRGALVRRVAQKRVCECLSTAERITGKKTEQRVLNDVNRIVDEKIAKLNERIQTRPIASALVPSLDVLGVEYSTTANCININFIGDESWPLAQVLPVGEDEPSDTELWLQIALISRPAGEIPAMLDNAGTWLQAQLPDLELPGIDLTGEEGVLPFDIQYREGWLVFRSKPEAESD